MVVGFARQSPPIPSVLDHAKKRGIDVRISKTPTNSIRRAVFLARLARKNKVALVHVYSGLNSRSAYYGPSLFGRRPLVTTMYEMAVHPSEYEHSSLVVGTGYTAEKLADRAGPVQFITPPVDVVEDVYDPSLAARFIEEWELDPDLIHVVIVTRLSYVLKELSVRLSIEAMRSASMSGFQLVIVGTGEAFEPLKALAAKVNTELGRRAIVFTGALADPSPAYSATDISIGMGASAARALSFGRPLVVSGEFGLFETWDESTGRKLQMDGFWSPDSQPDAVSRLRAQLLALGADRGRRSELGEFGRQFAERNLSLESGARTLVHVYEQALANYNLREWVADLKKERYYLAESWYKGILWKLRPHPRAWLARYREWIDR
nr:glycosyltransferase [Microbacterium bovistercoris]